MESIQPFWASANELYGEIPRKKETLINLIKDFDKKELIKLLAFFIDDVNRNKIALNGTYLLPYLNRTEKKRFKKLINLKEEFVIHKQQLFTAMKIAFKYANGNEKITEENKTKIGKFLLGINYLSDGNVRIKNKKNSEELLNTLVGDLLPVFFISAILNPSNRLTIHALARQYFNFVRYWKEHVSDQDLNTLEEDFKKISGVNLKDYFSLCFSLAYTITSEKEFKPLNLSKYLSNTEFQQEIEYLSNRFSLDIEKYKESPFGKKAMKILYH
jgi:hypothetical protein